MNKKPFKTIKSLQNWFGDRGEEIKKSYIKDWFIKDKLLFIKWSNKAPYYLTPTEPYDCNAVNWKSLYFEFVDDYYFDKEINEIPNI